MTAFRRYLLRSLLLVSALLAISVPAKANPLACVTLYYRVQNGPRQYIANNFCQVPSSSGPLITLGPACVLDTDYLDVCDWVEISVL